MTEVAGRGTRYRSRGAVLVNRTRGREVHATGRDVNCDGQACGGV